jgi:L-lactate dehydrogenase complex protein LldG
MSARENILARIRAAQGKPLAPSPAEREAVRAHLAAHAQSPRPRAADDLIACFRERALALSSTFDEAGTLADVPLAVASYLRRNHLPLEAACWPELLELGWGTAGLNVAARAARDGDLIGITGTFCAIAETGTLLMVSGPRTPGATSLLPETHIALVRADRIVRGMEEAWQLLRTEIGAPPRAATFISGPSRTADIEQTVTLGAHGPYRVHIVLLGH